MGSVNHIRCPACNGAVGITNVDRILKCAYCDARLLIDNPGFVPQYYIPTQTDEVTARRKLQNFLTQKVMPKGLLHHSRFSSATLCYVPFQEFKARRLGTMETAVEKVTRASLGSNMDSDTGLGVTYGHNQQKSVTRETEVIMGDLHRIEPAVTLPQFGLEHCGVFEQLKNNVALRPFANAAQRGNIRVYPPTIAPETIVEQLNIKGFSSSVIDDTTYVESRSRLVYYPLWRLRYRFSGRLYSAVLDGITGELIVAKAPEGDQLRVMTLLFGVTFIGVLLGNIFKSVSLGEHLSQLVTLGPAGVFGPVVTFLAIVVVGIGAVWALVWSQFRYPGEVCKWGTEIHVEKYNSLLRQRIRLPVMTPASLLKLLFQKGSR